MIIKSFISNINGRSPANRQAISPGFIITDTYLLCSGFDKPCYVVDTLNRAWPSGVEIDTQYCIGNPQTYFAGDILYVYAAQFINSRQSFLFGKDFSVGTVVKSHTDYITVSFDIQDMRTITAPENRVILAKLTDGIPTCENCGMLNEYADLHKPILSCWNCKI